MKLGSEGAVWAQELVDYAEANPENLSEWEQNLVSDYGEKVTTWDEECFISEKQLVALNKVCEALGLNTMTEDELEGD